MIIKPAEQAPTPRSQADAEIVSNLTALVDKLGKERDVLSLRAARLTRFLSKINQALFNTDMRVDELDTAIDNLIVEINRYKDPKHLEPE